MICGPIRIRILIMGKIIRAQETYLKKRKDLEFIVGKIGKNQDLDFVRFVDF